ncbi:MAG TPA: flagellar biosynthetic protein FliR [Myxococcaceae bacterium]|jgi:flagellar biosynthesis protein FliR|nr:flagellar biosynthetic protein FliR [Myxococcaceae bacterium]
MTRLLLDPLGGLGSEVTLWALAAARLLPVAWLCPLLGGPVAPPPVRLAVGLALAALAGARARLAPLPGPWAFAAALLSEACLGIALGLLAAAPVEAARFGGRMTDLLRGTSAEALLPGVGTREAASAELFARLAVVLGAGAAGWTVRVLVRSVAVVPLGSARPGAASALLVSESVVGILGSGLALAAPVAFLALALDAVLGFAGRGGRASGLLEVAAPARILGGAAVVWLLLGVAADRLLELLAAAPGALAALAERP